MTTRQFDPVLSAALRNELEALADAPEAAPAKGFLPTLRRPQVWISIVTAVVLIAATVGVLQVTGRLESQPAGESRVVDPLSQVTDPANGNYVARSVRTLLTVRGTGPGTHVLDVPAGVTSVRVLIGCAPESNYAIGIDSRGESSGGCQRILGGSFDMPVTAGTHDLRVSVPKGTDYALLVIVSPKPTVSSGGLIDPLTQIRDLRDPDALTGSTTPLLRMGSSDGAARSFTATPGQRLRAYLVCTPTSATTEATIGGHLVIGCMNSIAHWFDFTPTSRTIDAQVSSPDLSAWKLLVVRAPDGAKDTPANALLPFPATAPGDTVIARVRGVGDQATGTFVRTTHGDTISATCRGNGWLEIATADGTSGRGADCGARGGFTTGFGTELKDDPNRGKRQRYTVTPHGDVSWTVTITDAN